MVFLLLFIHYSSCLFHVRFFKPNGRTFVDTPDLNNFIIQIQTDSYVHTMGAYNHEYTTQTSFVDDPCVWMLKISGITVGRYNACLNRIDYVIGGVKYTVEHGKNSTVGHSTAFEEKNDKIDRKETKSSLVAESTGKAGNKQKDRMDSKAGTSTHKNKAEDSADSREFQLNLFVFNDLERHKLYGNDIKKETVELVKMVDKIYKENKMNIKIELTGSLSLKQALRDSREKIAKNNSNILTLFKRTIELVRYDPRNLESPLSKSDLAILLASTPIDGDPNELYQHHGMTYYGGANGLSRSYSVVYADKNDSKYFIAKKIAHEIAHSLGVRHDESNGFIMETTTCATCEDTPRIFSKESKAQMERFLDEYKDIFLIRSEVGAEEEERLVISKDEAVEFVRKQRKHSFMDIVNTRLGGRIPETSYFTYYLGISLIFYLISIVTAIYYLK